MQLDDFIDEPAPVSEWDELEGCDEDGPTEATECPCGGPAVLLGVLGRKAHYRCTACHMGLCVDI